MSGLLGSNGEFLSEGETEFDKIVNGFYCGQIQALHYIIYYLYRSPNKYDIDSILRYIEARYCHLIKEYPNFYNDIVKNEKELTASGEFEASYHQLFDTMLTFFKELGERTPRDREA